MNIKDPCVIEPFGVYENNVLRCIVQHPGRAAAVMLALGAMAGVESAEASNFEPFMDSMSAVYVDTAAGETVYANLRAQGVPHDIIVLDMKSKGIAAPFTRFQMPPDGVWSLGHEALAELSQRSVVLMPGDTVWAQVTARGIDPAYVSDVLAYNGIDNAATIVAGTTIVLPPAGYFEVIEQPAIQTDSAMNLLPADVGDGAISGAAAGESKPINESPVATVMRLLATDIVSFGSVGQAASTEANAIIMNSFAMPAGDASGVDGKVEIAVPSEFRMMPTPSVEAPYVTAPGTCLNETAGRPSAILLAMSAIALYNEMIEQPEYEAFQFSTLVVSDITSGDHKTHASGDKVDLVSTMIMSPPGTFDGPLFNRDSPNYSIEFTQEFVNRLAYIVGPDGLPLVENIEFQHASAIDGVLNVRGHRTHAHINTNDYSGWQSLGTPNTGPWCQLPDVWQDWNVSELTGFDEGADVVDEVAPTQSTYLTVDEVNALPYAVGDMEPVIAAYRSVAFARGWTEPAVDAWQPFMLDVVSKESNGCWNAMRGMEFRPGTCEQSNPDDELFQDFGFGQIIRIHDEMLARELGFTSHEDIIASPWNSMESMLVLFENYGGESWLYEEANGYHDESLVPDWMPRPERIPLGG